MSKYIKISQQSSSESQTESKPQQALSDTDKANIQKLKSLKGGFTIQTVMAELTRISRSADSDAEKQAEATKYLQSIQNKLAPMAQVLNNMGVKLPRN